MRREEKLKERQAVGKCGEMTDTNRRKGARSFELSQRTTEG